MKNDKTQYILCKIGNHLALLTYARVSNKMYDDFYIYDLASSNDGFEPEILKDTVIINHFASLISTKPLLEKDLNAIHLTENNFKALDIRLTLDEYTKLKQEDIQEIINFERSNHEQSLLPS